MKNYSKLFLTAMVILTALTAVRAIAPGNDNFADAQDLGAQLSGFVIGNNTGATQEADEPSHYTANNNKQSVWYKWTAPATRSMAIDVADENFTSAFAIYKSNVANPTFAQLVKVQSNADINGYQYLGSRINFWAESGKTYYIAVDWSNANPGENQTGSFTLKYYPNKFGYSSKYEARNHRASVSIYRPSNSMWYFLWNVYSINYETIYGKAGDQPMPADYDGDGRTDIAVVRNENGSKVWYVSFLSQTIWGLPTDQALTGDFDNDGRGDLVAVRSTGGNLVWYVRRSTDGSGLTNKWGLPGDKPVVGDFDGDGRTDFAVTRSTGGGLVWYILKSNNGAYNQYAVEQFGLDSDKVSAEDFDGDGKTDVAVYRPSNGTWYIHRSGSNEIQITQFGIFGDKPQPADYDLDGKADLAIFRPADGNWYFWLSGSDTQKIVHYGTETDTPTTSMNSLVQ
jgi:hypothetical protein